MQDLACCDYFRTPVNFQGADIYRFVGGKRIVELFPNHIELKRQHRLAKGDDWCDLLYYRK